MLYPCNSACFSWKMDLINYHHHHHHHHHHALCGFCGVYNNKIITLQKKIVHANIHLIWKNRYAMRTCGKPCLIS